MINLILTTYNGAILGPIARLLGHILEAIYYVLSLVGIENTGICIILFTFLVNGLMLPLQIKQQKFSRMSSIMNPEIMEIQKKYKNKKDQASQQKMQLETQAVYQKYGVSPASGCLPLLITFPILFALYRVIYNIPAYVDQVYDIYADVAVHLQELGVTVDKLAEFVQSQTYVVTTAVQEAKENASEISYFIDVLGQFSPASWSDLAKEYPALQSEIAEVSKNASHINSFLGLNIADTPAIKSVSILIPIFSVITQIISTKLSLANAPQQNTDENPTMQSMKMMNNIMPFVSGLMCFMFPIGVGIYWVAGNVFRIFQAIGIRAFFNHMDMDEEIRKNQEKTKKRFEKMGIDPSIATKELKNMSGKQKNAASTSNASKNAGSVKKVDYKRPNNTKYKEGSIAAYANMLNRNISSDDGKK